MKTVSLRELHEETGTWVRRAVRLGAITITDRGRPVARITATGEGPRANPFRERTLRRGYAKLMGRLGGGTDSTAIVSGDRGGR